MILKYKNAKRGWDSFTAVGRNGLMQQKGIIMSNYSGSAILLEPYNSKGVGNCWLTIPYEDLPDVIHGLQKLLMEVQHESRSL